MIIEEIPSGKFLTGDQTILGDENLVPSSIISGVNIFGVSGTAIRSEDIILGIIDENKKFQPLSFNGITSTASGDPETISQLNSWSSPFES